MEKSKQIPLLRFFAFSEAWKVEKLGKICDIIGGGTPETNIEAYWNGNIQWFTPTEIKYNFVLKSNRTITELGLKKSSAKLLPKGAILLTTRATIGEVSIALEICTTNQGFQSLIVKENINNIFIFNWLKQNKSELLKRATGSTFPEISKSKLQQLDISIPTLSEQQKIADFFTAIDDKLFQLKKKKNLLEQYKKGMMQAIFTQKLRFKLDDKESFNNWKEKKLGEICELITKGTTPKKFVDKGIKFIKIECFDNSEINIDKCAFIDTETHHKELKRSILQEGDLLFAIAGATIGKVNFVEKKLLPANTNQALAIIRLKHTENRSFIYQILKSEMMQKYILDNITIGAQPNLNLEQINNFSFFYPNALEQKKIADFLSAIDDKITITESQIKKMENWKKGLLQQMFV